MPLQHASGVRAFTLYDRLDGTGNHDLPAAGAIATHGNEAYIASYTNQVFNVSPAGAVSVVMGPAGDGTTDLLARGRSQPGSRGHGSVPQHTVGSRPAGARSRASSPSGSPR